MPLTNYQNGLTSFGIPLFGDLLDGGIPGNVYVVANPNDANLVYLTNRFGQNIYDDGSNMLQSTLQGAINACVDLRGDVIVVGPRTYVVTTPVLFNKKGITVLPTFNFGGGQDNGERFTINADATANIPCAVISEPCTIIGLGFDSANTLTGTGAVAGTVSLGPGNGFDGGNFVRLRDCRFTNWGHAAYAIDSQYNDYVKIEHCDFDGTINGDGNSANVFAAAISLIQGHYVTVEECTFRGSAYAILHGVPNPASAAHSNKNFLYKGNRVIVAAGTEKFINFGTLATYTQAYGLVADNWLMTATNATSYSDTVTNIKATGVGFSGNHYAE